MQQVRTKFYWPAEYAESVAREFMFQRKLAGLETRVVEIFNIPQNILAEELSTVVNIFCENTIGPFNHKSGGLVFLELTEELPADVLLFVRKNIPLGKKLRIVYWKRLSATYLKSVFDSGLWMLLYIPLEKVDQALIDYLNTLEDLPWVLNTNDPALFTDLKRCGLLSKVRGIHKKIGREPFVDYRKRLLEAEGLTKLIIEDFPGSLDEFIQKFAAELTWLKASGRDYREGVVANESILQPKVQGMLPERKIKTGSYSLSSGEPDW